MQENISVTGRVQIQVFDQNGNLIDSRDVKNLVVTSGKNFIASRMKDATASVMTHMGVGTSSTPAAPTDTNLLGSLVRVALTSTTVTNNNVQYVASFPAGTGTGTIYELGLFDAASAGNMLARTNISALSKGASDAVTVTWTITVG